MTFEPIHDQVVLQKVQVEQKTHGGIIIPVTEDRPGDTIYGKVVAAGPGKAYDGTGIVPMQVKEGDIVLFKPNAALKHYYMENEYFILREGLLASIVRNVELSDSFEFSADQFKQGPQQLESLL